MLSELRKVSEDLNRLECKWALVGALAVSAYCEPRTTRDIDIALVLESDREHEALVAALMTQGYARRQFLMHLEPTAKLGDRLEVQCSAGSPVAVDLLCASSGIEQEIVLAAELIEVLPSLIIPIACRGHLIAMKVLSQNRTERLKDRLDLQQLLGGAAPNDIQVARGALSLMGERGFSRGKDLKLELAQVLSEFAPQFAQ